MDDNFCIVDGSPLKKNDSQRSTKQEPAACAKCEHFRVATSIISLLPSGQNRPCNEARAKILEDENKQRVSEAGQRGELMRNDNNVWGFRPRMSDFCACNAKENVYQIVELKNRTSECPDFSPIQRRKSQCVGCVYRVMRDDPFSSIPASGYDPNVLDKMLEAMHTEWATEMSIIYAMKGNVNSAPKYHDYCNFLRQALPYPNVHEDCPDFEPTRSFATPFLSGSED